MKLVTDYYYDKESTVLRSEQAHKLTLIKTHHKIVKAYYQAILQIAKTKNVDFTSLIEVKNSHSLKSFDF